MRILVVEDDANLRENLKSRLTAEGFNVALAADGEEGLFAATEHPLDAVTVDLLERTTPRDESRNA